MTLLSIMGTLIVSLITATYYIFFKKGKVYNPYMPEDFTDLPYLPTETPPINPQTIESTSVPSAWAVEPPVASKATLEQVAAAMRDFEGGTNDANYRNNNPLNVKFYYGGYLPIYEPVRKSAGGFAIFKDYQTGWKYGCNMLRNKIHNHPSWTLRDMIENHAPASDNNPVDVYTNMVAKRCGITPDFKVRNLT